MDVYDTDEARIFGFEIRDLEATDTLTMLAGRAVPYNTPTDLGMFTEEVRQGAFNRSINGDAKGLPLHLFHGDLPSAGGNPMTPWPIGISREWHDRSDGLHGVWDLDDEPEAQRAGRLAKKGMLPYLSVRFQPLPKRRDGKPGTDIEYRSDRPHLIRWQARLVSTSVVSTPAYATAGVDWVRSDAQIAQPGAPGTELAKWAEYLERIKQGPIPR